MKRSNFLTLVVLLAISASSFSQDKFYTKTGKISFYSKATLENIEAHNRSTTCVLDTKTGNLQFAVLMKGFEFEKALMQEHFNENYVESHKFPKAEFKGQIINAGDINFLADGSHQAKVRGKLTIHGVTQDVETMGDLVVKGGKILTDATFDVALSDYNIEIPNLVKDNIGKTVKIKVDCDLEPLK